MTDVSWDVCWVRTIRSLRSLGGREFMSSFARNGVFLVEGGGFFSATLYSSLKEPPGVQSATDAWWVP